MSQNESVIKSFKSGGSMNKELKTLGIDLAKNIFQLHGANGAGKQVLSKRLGREQFIEFMSHCTPCLVGIEACSGSHYWARTLQSLGHEVKIIAPQFVKPYVMANKNDKNDARGIAEAVTRPDKRVSTSLKILGHPSPQNSLANATGMPPAALAVLVPLDFQPPTGLKICAPQ